MDYLGDDPNPNPDTQGLIVDDVRLLGTITYLLTDRSLDHARSHGEAASDWVSLDGHFRRKPARLTLINKHADRLFTVL